MEVIASSDGNLSPRGNIEPEVLWERRNQIRIMTYNRPDSLNAMTSNMSKLEEQRLQVVVRH